MYNLFLDDDRQPESVTWIPYYTHINNTTDWIVVRTYHDFIHYIEKNGLPNFISFDHDLGKFDKEDELSGMSCAKWLVDYCLDHESLCPPFVVHSKNPEGSKNITGLLTNYNQFYQKNVNSKKNSKQHGCCAPSKSVASQRF